jgi:hypothetical protein
MREEKRMPAASTGAASRETLRHGELVREVRVMTLDNGLSWRGKPKYRAHLDVAFTFRKPAASHALCVDTSDASSS